ncbi:26016_t:CDS:1, partial [Gigaspora margarita]
SLNSFLVTFEVFNQSIEDIKEKQPQYDIEIPIENNKTLQQTIKYLKSRV